MATKRTKRTIISRAAADKFSQKLEQLPEKKKTELTTKELIFENSEQLDNVLDKGYDYEDLVDILKEDGIKISKTTLRQYLSEARRERANQEKSTEDSKHLPKPASDRQNNKSADSSETIAKKSPKKFGKSRPHSEGNSARYPDGHGEPIELNEDL